MIFPNVPFGGRCDVSSLEGQQKSSTLLPQIYPLQDLFSAAKSAVVHGVNRRDDAGPNGGPRRVAPGEVFSSPRSGASEVGGVHREHGLAFRIGYPNIET